MASLLSSSSLNTLPNNVSAPAANASSTNLHPHSAMLSQILMTWVDARLEEQHAPAAFMGDTCFGTLMAQLLHEQLAADHTNNKSSIFNNQLSNVPQIVDILLENEHSGQLPSTVVDDLASSFDNDKTNAILEIVSCIILKTSMKPALLGKHLTESRNHSYLPMVSSALPTFQFGRLSLQDTFLEVRSALMAWVNQQFRNNIDHLFVDLIRDFGPSWNNGLAFVLLIYCFNASYLSGDLQLWLHQQLQQCINNDNDCTKDDNQANVAVLSYVFDIAKQRMGIFASLTSKDMLEMVTSGNEWCVILYVYEFYNYGSRQQQQQSSTSLVSDLQQTLEWIHSVSHTRNDKDAIVPLHPLDDTDENIISDYSHKVSLAVSLWNMYSAKIKDPSPPLMASVSAMRQAYDLFTQGLAFKQISKEIQTDLAVVETTLNDVGASLSIDSVQQLEYQVDNTKSLLHDMENQFDVLVQQQQQQQQQRYSDHLQQLHERTNLVYGWTRQVHTSMVENDCLRSHIQQWIDLIEERNSITDDLGCDAMTTTDLIQLDHLDITALYCEHEQLRKVVDQFESTEDTKQLRERIKQHTTTPDHQQQIDLTPADLSILGVSLITLNMLDRLWQLLLDRGLRIDRLVRRLQWEHLFEKAVEWIFLKDVEIDRFLRTQALWCEQEDDGFNDLAEATTTTLTIRHPTSSSATTQQIYHHGQGLAEQKINLLMQLEHDISDFDGDSFMGVWAAYQDMVDFFGDDGVPNFLKQRQTGFEAAFDDLNGRCGLARQAVEQQLVMMDLVIQFKHIKKDGEVLRRKLLVENDTMDGIFGSSNGRSGTANGDSDDSSLCGNDSADLNNTTIELCVEEFKETCTGFLAHARTQIPYLNAPIMSTAMGALDAQSTDATNDAIRNSLHAYGISLSLISDGLEQLLMVRQQIRSLQQRARLVCKQMERLTTWMDDRRCLFEKSDFTIYDRNDDQTNMAAAFTSQSVQQQNKNELLIRLEKELGTITYRLQQMENDDLAKLVNTVELLQSDMDGVNGVSSCRQKVVDALECLVAAQHNIKMAVQGRSSKLVALKQYLAWQIHWIKTHQWILSMARKLWDFCVKKARYCPLEADHTSPKSSSVGQRDIELALHSHQDRVTDIGGNHMALLADLYTSMVDGVSNWEKVSSSSMSNSSQQASGKNCVQSAMSGQVIHDFSARQSLLVQKYRTLVDLSHYAATLVTQRSAISTILTQLDDASRDGERLRDSMTKSTTQIMKTDLHHQPQHSQQRQSPKEKVDLFRQLVIKIKKASTTLEYAKFTPNLNKDEPDSILSLAQTQQLHQADAKALITSKMDELETLDGQLTDLLKTFDKAEKKRKLVDQYNADVVALTRWIQDQMIVLENRHLNVSAEAMDELLNGASWNDLDEQHRQFVSVVGSFGEDRLKNMHDKVVTLVEDVATQSGQLHGGSLDVTVAVTQNLGTAINNFTTLQQKVTDESITLDAVGKRMDWEKVLQEAHGQLERMQGKLMAWCKKMNEWINGDNFFGATGDDWQEQAHEQMLALLYEDLETMMTDKNEFTQSAMVKVHLLYDTFVQCFPKLPRPTATPDHIEDTMSSLDLSSSRYQETLISKNKELDIIQDYVQWNTNLNMVYLASRDYLDRLNLFVTHTARWRPPATREKEHGNVTDHQEHSLDDSNTIHQQCTDLTQQLHVLETRLNILYDDATTTNASNTIIQHVLSQRDQLVCFSHYVPQLACFMGLVIKQNEMVQALLLRMSQVGDKLTLQVAENKSSDDSVAYTNLHASSDDRYDQLIKQVDQLRSDIAAMIYPVRPTMDDSTTATSKGGMVMDNDQNYWMALDYTDNNVIRNILTGDLMDLEHTLMDLDRIIHISHQPQVDLTYLKRNSRLSNITVDTKKTQGMDQIIMLATQNVTTGHLTKSLSLNHCSMTSSPKSGARQVLKTRSSRLATKITPGQVGKYWIGNSQPRLIYCRVLKSNVVMARVGGGWVELSQFLQDHGCNDGAVILDEPVPSENISPVDQLANMDYENFKNSDSSSSLTLSKSSGKTSTSTRSLLPMAGYTDGYQYVRIDEWGNHLALDMVRVDDHYFVSQK